ncbi:DsbA family protein [Streptomyces armeniacus]|uniref:DsbA family protein n=1 Tax=Streptomyces armeniacus TaxID=83291 RepID=A0A345XJ62_9ACTN|nr:DsbA family protein [Streptomyces armeniacus]AXK31678.1 DsbA family protein [Streptomyces armeniacus]
MNASRNNRTKTTLVLALVLVAALGLIGLSAFAGADSDSDSGGKPADTDTGTDARDSTSAQERALLALQRRTAGDPAAMGDKDAPVVLIEYSDFQCPFCGKFARDTKPELVEKYVDAGVLRLEWRHFPIFGDESQAAARAGWAAGEQGRFWEFHDLAYGKERKKNSGEFADGKLTAMAKAAGVKDLAKFKRDMESQAARQAVARDATEGQGLGVTSTPAFLINSTPLLGAQPTAVFKEAIDRARKAAAAKKPDDDGKTG